jgi:2-haloacid dehalogenase
VNWNDGFARWLTPFAGGKVAEVIASYHRFERRFERDKPHRLYRDVIVRSLREAAHSNSISLTSENLNEIVASWGFLPKFADAERMLASLRAHGFKIAVLTNCDEDLFAATQQSFDHPFDLFITAEAVRSYKPERDHFRAFAERTGVDSKRWVHVANSWFHDIAPARQLGIRSVWLDRDHTGEDAAAASAHVHTGDDVVPAILQILR